jgi:hypothetical protein
MNKRIAIGLAVALAICASCEAFMLWRTSQVYWIRTTVRMLRSYSPPPASKKTVGDGKWIVMTADREYLVFSNGWAYFAANTIHESERIGDVAILCASDGTLYISHFHFCIPHIVLPRQPQPKDLQDFLRKSGANQGWKKL